MSAEFGPRHGAAPVLVLDLTVTLFSVKLEGLQDLQTSLISTARRFSKAQHRRPERHCSIVSSCFLPCFLHSHNVPYWQDTVPHGDLRIGRVRSAPTA
jgi:hypothetical protein